MIRKLSSLLLLCLCALHTESQNIVSNGSFEIKSTSKCVEPYDGFKNLIDWTSSASTPDLFQFDCQFSEEGWIFWDNSLFAYDGSNYSGLVCEAQYNGVFRSEGISNKLLQPLSLNHYYYFELAYRPKGIYHHIDSLKFDCDFSPEKHINVYTSHNEIEIQEVVGDNNLVVDTYSTGNLVAQIFDINMSDTTLGAWHKLSSCFLSQGGGTHLGISMPLGTFTSISSCAIENRQAVFQWFYFDIDAIKLLELPPSVDIELSLCRGKSLNVNLNNLIDNNFLKDYPKRWTDNFESVNRTFVQPGKYTAEIILECGTIPMNIFVSEIDCSFRIYVPNVFTPNHDGDNDNFHVFIKSEFPVNNFQFEIYNGWGNQVHKSTDLHESWSGLYNNELLASGNYIWHLEYERNDGLKNIKQIKMGTVLLIH